MIKNAIRGLAHRLDYEILRNVGLDPWTDAVRLLHSRPVRTFFDVGANVGQSASRFHAMYPNASIYCFEPFPSSFQRLSEALPASPLIKKFQLAVADEVGTRALHVLSDSETNSLLPAARAGMAYTSAPPSEIPVRVTTLDAFTFEQGINEIDLLKTDTQSGELQVMRGARRLLESQSIHVVIAEVMFSRLYEGCATFDQLLPYMRERGYNLYGLYHMMRGKDGLLGWADATFVSDRLMGAADRQGAASQSNS